MSFTQIVLVCSYMRVAHFLPYIPAPVFAAQRWWSWSSLSAPTLDAVEPVDGTLLAYIHDYPFVVGVCERGHVKEALTDESVAAAKRLFEAAISFPGDYSPETEDHLGELVIRPFATARKCAFEAYLNYDRSPVPVPEESGPDEMDEEAELTSDRNLRVWARGLAASIIKDHLFITFSDTYFHLQVLVGRERAAQLRFKRGKAITVGRPDCLPPGRRAGALESRFALEARVALRGGWDRAAPWKFCSCSYLDQVYLFGIDVARDSVVITKTACPLGTPANPR